MDMTPMTPSVALSPSLVVKIKFFLCAAMVFQIYDWYYNLLFEFQYIWGDLSSSRLKWGYIWSRYGGLTLQLVYCISWISILHLDSVPVGWCRILNGFVSVMWEGLLLCLGLTLRYHTVPLYTDRPKLAAVLNLLACLDFITGVTWTVSISQRIELGGACVFLKMPHDTIHYSLTRLLFHGIFWIIVCLARTFEESQAVAWRLIVQNVSPGFGAISVLFMGILTGARLSDFSDTKLPVFVHFLPCFAPPAFVLAAVINCRLIKNIELARMEVVVEDDSTIELGRIDPQQNPS